MTDANVQVQEQPKTPEIEADPEAARYAELAKELGDEDGGEQDEQPAKVEQAKPDEGEKEAAKEPAKEGEQPKAKLTPEELERNYNNSQAALREAREEARRSKDQIEAFTKAINEAKAARQQKIEAEQPTIPDVNENPVAYFQHQLAEMQQKLDEATTGTRKTAEQIETQQRQTQFWNAVISSETEFRAKETDYDDACKHLEAGRVSELKVMYPDESPKAMALAEQYGLPSVEALREAVLNQDRMNVAVQAMQLGISPAQMYYDLAKQRGYAKAEVLPKVDERRETAKNVIDMQRRGAKAAKTITGGEGGKSDNPLAITDLIDLYDEDPDEADKVFDQMRKQGLLG